MSRLKIGDIVKHYSNPCFVNDMYSICKVVSFDKHYSQMGDDPTCEVEVLTYVYSPCTNKYKYNFLNCKHKLHSQLQCPSFLRSIGTTKGVSRYSVTKLSDLELLVRLSAVNKDAQ